MEDRTRVHVFVNGDLQGIDFRHEVAGKARELGVTGWVKTLATAASSRPGGPLAMRSIVWSVLCRAGPRGAKVANVQVDREPPKNEKTFKIR